MMKFVKRIVSGSFKAAEIGWDESMNVLRLRKSPLSAVRDVKNRLDDYDKENPNSNLYSIIKNWASKK